MKATISNRGGQTSHPGNAIARAVMETLEQRQMLSAAHWSRAKQDSTAPALRAFLLIK